MPSHVPADRPAAEPPAGDTVDALISQARRLRGGLDAVRRATLYTVEPGEPHGRWQRALLELAGHQLDDLDGHLAQLREVGPSPVTVRPTRTRESGTPPPRTAPGTHPGPHPEAHTHPRPYPCPRPHAHPEPAAHTADTADTADVADTADAANTPATPDPAAPTPDGTVPPPRPLPDSGPDSAEPQRSLLSRVGTAEWNLLTDQADWSAEFYEILGRAPDTEPLTLDELPAVAHLEDRARLTAMVTDCLVDGKPIDGEFRVLRPDGTARTVHMMGEPVLDVHGGTASMWAVLRDVSALRRSQRVLSETHDSLQRHRHVAQKTEHRLAVELQEAVLPAWRGSLQLPRSGSTALDLAGRYLPAGHPSLIGGDWYDALELPDGQVLLSVGDLGGHGVPVTSSVAVLLGALRGMAVTGARPGPLLGLLNHLVDDAAQPALGSALCCRYAPGTRTLTWAQAGHPAPLLFRGGTGWPLPVPDGVLLGTLSGAAYGQAEVELVPGDVLLLHTDGLVARRSGVDAQRELLALAPEFTAARCALECARRVVERFDGQGAVRDDDACVLVARVTA
ncbi:SpoIIE family protein phosphatase [Streptomyces sp. NPDC058045]|uniref:PP2C family protein-serine/threonine phosphatase n=1 Tax=Streptomyces sp. NPDC058045 TaxID=3346311 RepID=UPI0036E10397